eukprot:6492400-Amphidinium_carterae.2
MGRSIQYDVKEIALAKDSGKIPSRSSLAKSKTTNHHVHTAILSFCFSAHVEREGWQRHCKQLSPTERSDGEVKKLWLAQQWEEAKVYIKKVERVQQAQTKKQSGVFLTRTQLVKTLGGKRAAAGYIKKIEAKKDLSLVGECEITGTSQYLYLQKEVSKEHTKAREVEKGSEVPTGLKPANPPLQHPHTFFTIQYFAFSKTACIHESPRQRDTQAIHPFFITKSGVNVQDGVTNYSVNDAKALKVEMNGVMTKCTVLLELLEGEADQWLLQSPMAKFVKTLCAKVKDLRNNDPVLMTLLTVEPAQLRKGFPVSDADFDALFSKSRESVCLLLEQLKEHTQSLQETYNLCKKRSS